MYSLRKYYSRSWGYNLVVEHLPNIHKALGSIPSTAVPERYLCSTVINLDCAVIAVDFLFQNSATI
ncbi:hypothetical protein ACRRTK_001455 [Alexandromys fortis]